MATGDGWLIRLRLPRGEIPPSDLSALADLADATGVEALEVTGRANLQMRVPDPDRLVTLGDAFRSLGLAPADARGERARAVLVPPLAGHDRFGPDDAADVVAAVVTGVGDLLAAEPHLRLPARWCVVIDLPATIPVPLRPATVVARPHRSATETPAPGSEAEGWTVEPGPNWPTASEPGGVRPPAVTTTRTGVASAVIDLARLAAAAVEAAVEPVDTARSGSEATSPLGDLSRIDRSRPATGAAVVASPAVGVIAHPDPNRVNLLVRSFLGRLDPDQIRALATVPAIAIRFTHRRGVALIGIESDAITTVTRSLEAAGLSTDPEDPRHRVSACRGAPGCDASEIDTVAVAHRVALLLGPTEMAHVSGCAKVCGEPDGVTRVVGAEGARRWVVT